MKRWRGALDMTRETPRRPLVLGDTACLPGALQTLHAEIPNESAGRTESLAGGALKRHPECAEKLPARKPARGALKRSPRASSPRRRRGHRYPQGHVAKEVLVLGRGGKLP